MGHNYPDNMVEGQYPIDANLTKIAKYLGKIKPLPADELKKI